MADYSALSPEEAEIKRKANVKRIWTVAGILSVITTIEFIFALGWPESMNNIRWVLNMIFFSLTIVKAYYIIAEFMHLKHEAKSLILSILLPLMFLLWAIAAFLMEGSSIFEARFF